MYKYVLKNCTVNNLLYCFFEKINLFFSLLTIFFDNIVCKHITKSLASLSEILVSFSQYCLPFSGFMVVNKKLTMTMDGSMMS